MRGGDGRESGAAAIQGVIVYPVVFLLIFAMVQGAVYFHGDNVARHVANGAVQVARLDGATDADGYAEADARLAQASSALGSPQVHITRTTAQVSATVRGTVATLVPGVKLTVRQTAVGPVERFTSRGQP